MMQLTIPQPCNENWDNMSQNQNGRHCSSCAQTVTDFTLMNDEQVKKYFLENVHQRICGRFRPEQLQQINIELPQNIFQLYLPVWKQFLVASLLSFGFLLFSCTASTQGKVINDDLPVEYNNIPSPPVIGDTIPTRHLVGEPAATQQPKSTCSPAKDSSVKHRTVVGKPAARHSVQPAEVMGKMLVSPVKKEVIEKN